MVRSTAMPRKELHHRRSIRLPGHDYRDGGTYFVTMCVRNRECLFGRINNGAMELNEWGRVAADCMEQIPNHFPGVTISAFVVMPNHVHALMHIDDLPTGDGRGVACYAPTERPIGPSSGSLGAIIRSFKSAVTKRIRDAGGFDGMLWQRNYYERIVRTSDECDRIRTYIADNPRNWTMDDECTP